MFSYKWAIVLFLFYGFVIICIGCFDFIVCWCFGCLFVLCYFFLVAAGVFWWCLFARCSLILFDVWLCFFEHVS